MEKGGLFVMDFHANNTHLKDFKKRFHYTFRKCLVDMRRTTRTMATSATHDGTASFCLQLVASADVAAV